MYKNHRFFSLLHYSLNEVFEENPIEESDEEGAEKGMHGYTFAAPPSPNNNIVQSNNNHNNNNSDFGLAIDEQEISFIDDESVVHYNEPYNEDNNQINDQNEYNNDFTGSEHATLLEDLSNEIDAQHQDNANIDLQLYENDNEQISISESSNKQVEDDVPLKRPSKKRKLHTIYEKSNEDGTGIDSPPKNRTQNNEQTSMTPFSSF
jgi:hypothetical protein